MRDSYRNKPTAPQPPQLPHVSNLLLSMTTKKFYGYQGFTPCHLVHPPAAKYPRDFLMNKYDAVGQGQVYSKQVISSAMNFDNRPLNSDSFVVKASDFKRSDRRGVSALHESEDVRTR